MNLEQYQKELILFHHVQNCIDPQIDILRQLLNWSTFLFFSKCLHDAAIHFYFQFLVYHDDICTNHLEYMLPFETACMLQLYQLYLYHIAPHYELEEKKIDTVFAVENDLYAVRIYVYRLFQKKSHSVV